MFDTLYLYVSSQSNRIQESEIALNNLVLTRPTHHTQWFSIAWPKSAAPNARAGFMAAPVSGPPMRMSAAIVRPMAKPAMDLKAPRGSAARPP